MYRVIKVVLSRHVHPREYAQADQCCLLSKQLYNASLFRIRQSFTGWEKTARTPNEKEVFEELALLKKTYPDLTCKKVLSYKVLEKLMRVTRNPDFFSGLPMQTAQAVVKDAVNDFQNWLKALNAYRKDPSRFTGKPRMPHYCKNDRKSFTITNQDAVLYPCYEDTEHGRVYSGMQLKLPGIRHRLRLLHLPEDARLKEVKVCPYYGKYHLFLTLEEDDLPASEERPNIAGIDPGIDNIAAIVTTDHASRVYKGGAVLSQNRLFQKEKARAAGILLKGTTHKRAHSKHLDFISRKHDACIRDMLHKISTDIIRFCEEHRVGTIVLGNNPLWKQRTGMGKVGNQNFVSVPHATLRRMITYKAEAVGIKVIDQEESYTSKADVTSSDPMPVYGKEADEPAFSGRRIRRGLYRCRSGLVINADCNGAANILRKAFPDAWSGTDDFRFLAHPGSVSVRDLNQSRAAG